MSTPKKQQQKKCHLKRFLRKRRCILYKTTKTQRVLHEGQKPKNPFLKAFIFHKQIRLAPK